MLENMRDTETIISDTISGYECEDCFAPAQIVEEEYGESYNSLYIKIVCGRCGNCREISGTNKEVHAKLDELFIELPVK